MGIGSIKVARSALNTIVELPGYPDISQHPLIQRFFRGVFNLRPPPAPTQYTWDTNTVLTYIKHMENNTHLTLKQLTLKLVALLMLLAATRVHCIHAFSVKAMSLIGDTCTFYPIVLQKQARPSFPGDPITYRAYHDDVQLCVHSCLREYLDRRAQLVPEETHQLLITYRKPHHPAHKDTIARWLKSMLKEAGIDTTRFTAHSYRSATTSNVRQRDVPIQVILKQGQWSSENTFGKYYSKEIEYDSNLYGRTILELPQS